MGYIKVFKFVNGCFTDGATDGAHDNKRRECLPIETPTVQNKYTIFFMFVSDSKEGESVIIESEFNELYCKLSVSCREVLRRHWRLHRVLNCDENNR